ncbi:MAG: DnaD domain-containing protein [Erysipelotrichaceae bacterium]
MEEMYHKPYFNRRNYILDQIEHFSMNSDELLLVLLIDFCNEQNMVISHALLADKTHKGLDEIDKTLTSLTNKGYLDIRMGNRQIVFDISGVFKEQRIETVFNSTLFEVFENEFGRTFSQMEVSRISDWMKQYEQQLIIYALREAVIYNKKSLDYIDKILVEWKQRSLSVEDVENGVK